MSIVIDDLIESITIEISNGRAKNMVITCIYRTPGSCIAQFNKNISELYEKQSDKLILVCGEFSIDLVKSNEQKETAQFINNMFSLSLYRLLLQTSIITSESATIIVAAHFCSSNGRAASGSSHMLALHDCKNTNRCALIVQLCPYK